MMSAQVLRKTKVRFMIASRFYFGDFRPSSL